MNKWLGWVSAMVCGLCAAAGAQVPTAGKETVAIKAGHIVDVERGAVLDGKVILIEGGRITDIVDRMPAVAPSTVIDLSSSWIVPGLMDLHTHVLYDYQEELCTTYARDGNGYRTLLGLKKAQEMLRAGFTTLRDVGNAGDYADTELRRAFENGLFQGPTFINAGKIIAPFGGQADMYAPQVGPCWNIEYIDADGVEEVRKAVRKNIFYGARTIKMVTDFRRNSHGIYTEEEVRVAAEEAHRAGLILAVHAKEDATARPAVLGGADSIEHGYTLTDSVLKLMKEHGTYLVPTDVPLQRLHHAERPELLDFVRERSDRLRRAYKIGVPLAFGTDDTHDQPGLDRGQVSLEFIDGWIDAGVPPVDILRALTINGAKLLKITEQRGSIAKGRYADLVAVPANPLSDIRVLMKSTFVMKDGKVVRQ